MAESEVLHAYQETQEGQEGGLLTRYQCVFAPVLVDVTAPDPETARRLAQAELARRATAGELRPTMYEVCDDLRPRRLAAVRAG